MIPNVEHPQQFYDLRPISLCIISNKSFSKILNVRLATILPRIICISQSGFVKVRSITENILAQEIINDIGKPSRGGNVVLMLDMTKAYDSVSWNFLCIFLRKMELSELWINLIHNYISHNWYSVAVNGIRHGFFKSSRGLRQGNPLFPLLFYP